ncbi:solute carrier family 22 member 8 [Elysia marginata]|uniref:Solute carrier family 22 member 8 n=1 Tax=Elysia marginata TaxID=1093978 RepID=A0AAV4F6M1_9GAST|nr:solute carrier family 22 member 8 [Elysia marginata]
MNKEDSIVVDNILVGLGPLGRYQILHIIVVLLSMPPAGFQLFSNVFIAKAVPHHCASPPAGSNVSDVFGYTGNFTVTQEECRLVLKDNSSVLDSTTCVYGNEYKLPEDASVVSQYNLVCDKEWLAKFSQTAVILGQGIGGILSSIFSDRRGRKTTIVFSNFGLLVCGLVSAYAPNFVVFIVFRVLIGGFQQGVSLSSATYILELMPLEYRAAQFWLVGGTWGLSVMLFAVVSSFFKDHSWRSLQTTISLASLAVLIQLWYMDESLRWLLANGKTKAVTKIIRRIGGVNGKEFEKMLLPRFTAAISFFTIYLTATSLSGDPYINFGLTALMELPSNVFFFFCLNRLGRKTCLRTVYITMGVGVMLAGFFKALEKRNSTFSTLTLLASLGAMSGASGCFTIMFSYTPEVFPTNLRSQAMGVSSFMARVGGMLAPFAGFLWLEVEVEGASQRTKAAFFKKKQQLNPILPPNHLVARRVAKKELKDQWLGYKIILQSTQDMCNFMKHNDKK